LDRIKGLREYVKMPAYREALGLPKTVQEEYTLLAQGEYNINYLFTHPVSGRKLLLRVNCGSQMHLSDQIGYEYHALRLLEGSKRTPRAYYVDGSLEMSDHGILVMEFLPGRSLDYHTDLACAAGCLADIHSVQLPDPSGLVAPASPLRAILEECEEMVKVYMQSSLGRDGTKRKLRGLLDAGWEKIQGVDLGDTYKCCVNTELNSTNFLVDDKGGPSHLIDWEKPICGDPAQDLGHFLAPTTTFWKTDVILTRAQMEDFLDTYIQMAAGRFDTGGLKERVYMYIPITCLRGVTWCAMAWVQYQQPGRLICNPSTSEKLSAYLSDAFLDGISGISMQT
jgi:aminoglycoside phosphotransferase (APT) family kinase protein